MVIKKQEKRIRIMLLLMLLVTASGLLLAYFTSSVVKKPLYDAAVDAAHRMSACMEEIAAEKARRGIEIPPEDVFSTGMIGEDFNEITTTSGDLAAKRTSANPDTAAMMVFMLDEAGVKAGDTVGCNFSGSFPALNIATVCACDAMGIKVVYICACGASTWGANNPGLSFPEMADILYKKTLISAPPALVTPGGGGDSGRGLDTELFSEVWDRAEALGYPTLTEEDFEKNVLARKAALDAYDIDCFVAVGGHLASLGRGDVVYLLGQGIIHEEVGFTNSGSGLVERYLNEGTPSVLLLNIKKLAADYSLPFDPEKQAEIGTSGVYYEKTYNNAVLITAASVFLYLLILFKKLHKKSE